MNPLAAASLERAKAELVGRRAMRKRLADEDRHDSDVKDVETPSRREQWEESRIDELRSRVRR